nr:MAG TPA: Scavenger receptor class B member-BI, transmembrane domain, cholesterol, SIGNALING [Caudoviricetes sp.]
MRIAPLFWVEERGEDNEYNKHRTQRRLSL